MAIITIEDYKTFTNKNNPNDDAKLQPIVDMANEYIPLYCNTTFDPIVVTGARIDPFGTRGLIAHAPLISIEDVKIITSVGVTEDVAAADYITDLEEGWFDMIDYVGVMPTKAKSLLVDYTHGHSIAPTPVVLATYELVRHYEKREFSKIKDLGNGQSVEYAPSEVIPMQVKSMLDIYRVL